MRVNINESIIQMSLRWLTSGVRDFNVLMAEQRLTQSDLVWLSEMASNKRRLKAANALPVSLYRVHYNTLKVSSAYLSDDEFREVGNKLIMFMEFCHFARLSGINPLLAVGLDDIAYRVFETGSFDTRMMLVSRGGFSIGTRCNLRNLKLNQSSPDDQLSDVTVVLLGDLRHFQRQGVGVKGRVTDYPATMPRPSIAVELLERKLQPKLVAQYTGLDHDVVDSLKRRVMRANPLMQSQSGRIPSAETTMQQHPLHSLLYLTIYSMLADEPLLRTNARAAMVAHSEYSRFCTAVGVSPHDMISTSNAYQLSNALRSRAVVLAPCNHCHEIHAKVVAEPNRCIWCGH